MRVDSAGPGISISTIFIYRQDKIFRFFELRGSDMAAWRQNIGTKGLVGKILQRKKLADLGIAGLPLDAVNAPPTIPIMGLLYPRSRLLVTRTGDFAVEGCGKESSFGAVWEIGERPVPRFPHRRHLAAA